MAPSEWKGSLFTFLYKGKGDKLDPDNFRGISLLSVCAKVYGKLLLDRLQPILEPGLLESQCGFRKGRGCPDLQFSLRRLTELARAHRAPLWVAFVDFRKAFDCVNRKALWAILEARGVPHKLIALLRDLYSGCEGRVRVGEALSAPFQIGSGVRQGCALSPLLFSVFIDTIMRAAITKETAQLAGFRVGYEPTGLLTAPSLPTNPTCVQHRMVTDLLYADDAALTARSRDGLTHLLRRLQDTAQDWGLTINITKTKAMVFHPHAALGALPSPIGLRGGQVEFVDRFLYLGAIWTPSGCLDLEINKRAGVARGAISQLQPLWSKKGVCRSLKLQLVKALVPPALSYACETWAPTNQQLHRLDVVQQLGIRKALGVTPLDRVPNHALRQQAGLDDMGTYTRQQRLRYLGHVARDPNRLTHALLFATHVTHSPNRRQPRIHHTLVDQLREDVQVLFRESPQQGSMWYMAAQDRLAWRTRVRALSASDQTPS